jgi:hypothetical protein
MALLTWANRALIGVADPVHPGLLAAYPELAILRVRRGGLLPRLGGWALGKRTVAGITVGRLVVLGRDCPATAELLLHELAHARQFEALRGFPLRYWWETLRRGYHENRFEIEARAFAASRLRVVPRPTTQPEDP